MTPSLAGDPGLFGPDSVTWRVHADPLAGLAGLRALLLQALHPVAVRAVAANSRFREQTWDRLAATADYVGTTTFGGTQEALRVAARVRAIHASIRGIDPDSGLEYRADDADLLLWIHCALVESLLDVVGRGSELTPAQRDRFVHEQVRSAALVGLEPDVVPASAADLYAYLDEVRPQLRATFEAREAASYVIAPPMRPVVAVALPAWAGMAGLAFASLPSWARRMYAMPELPGAAGLTDATATVALRALRAALTGVSAAVPVLREHKHLREARQRLASAPTAPVIDLSEVERAVSTEKPGGAGSRGRWRRVRIGSVDQPEECR